MGAKGPHKSVRASRFTVTRETGKRMCGIVGYVGPAEAVDFLLEGLRRLEYRGYDSAGVATLDDGLSNVTKTAGRVEDLAQALKNHPARRHGRHRSHALGHARPATDVNAHPHLDGDEVLALVHNGVIENFARQEALVEARLRIPLGYRQRSDRPTHRAYELGQLPRRDRQRRRPLHAADRSRAERRWLSFKAPMGWRWCFAIGPT